MASGHKHLAKTKTFWWALLTPLVIGFFLGCVIGFNTQLGGLCFSSQCVQRFFDIYKFPVAIMGLSLPLVAMVAAIHRSVEAATQIEVALKQYGEAIANNRFGNYLKHREGFEKLIDGYCTKRYHRNGCKTFVNTSYFYAALFPDASFDNVEWSGHYNKTRYDSIERSAGALMDQIESSDEEFDVEKFMKALCLLLGYLNINYSPAVMVKVSVGEGKDKIRFMIPELEGDARSIFNAVRDVYGVLVLLNSYIGVVEGNRFHVNDKYVRIKQLLEISEGGYEIPRSA